MSKCPRISLFLLAVLLLASFHTREVHGAELCGRVWSGSRPIGNAMVLASAEGVIATTDSTGSFCLEDLEGSLQKVQVLALGFGPIERWIYIDAETDPVRIELTPLRSLSVSGRMTGSPEAEPTKPLPPLEKWGMIPFFVLPGDEDSLASLPPTPGTKALIGLHHRLMDRIAKEDSVGSLALWTSMSEQADRVMGEVCPKGVDSYARGFGFACDYVQRVRAYAYSVQVYLAPEHAAEQEDSVLATARSLVRALTDYDDPRISKWAGQLAGVLE